MSLQAFTAEAKQSNDYFILAVRATCLEQLYSFIRENQIRNQSLLQVTDNKTDSVDYYLSFCSNKEKEYLHLRKNLPPYLEKAKTYIEDVENQNYCQKVFQMQPTEMKRCQQALNGMVDKGLSYASAYMYNFV